jgi:hypothetical protein
VPVVFPSWWNNGNLLVIDCGIDESATKNHSKSILVVSGQFGSTSKMKKLDKQWRAALADYQVPYFHAQEFWNPRTKIYKHLSMGRRSRLLDALVGYIDKYVEFGISAHIDPQQYIGMTSDRFRSQFGSPYTFTMEMLFVALRLYLSQWGFR